MIHSLTIGTIESYISTIRVMLNHFKRKPAKISVNMISKYLSKMFDKKRLSPRTQHNYFAALKWYMTKIVKKEGFTVQLNKIKN